MFLINLFKNFKMPLSTFSAVITTLITIAGGIYAFRSYDESLPDMLVEADSLTLHAMVEPSEIYPALVSIENTYGRVTADKINDMKKIAEHLRYTDHAAMEKLMRLVYDNIDAFQTRIREWKPEEIAYLPSGIIIWPDGTAYDVAHNPQADKLFPNEYAAVRRDPSHITATLKTNLQQQAYTLYQPFGENHELRLKVADELRVVRSKIEILLNTNHYFVEVQLTLINKSTTPNFLTSLVALRLENPTNKALLWLRLPQADQRKLDGKDIKRVKARSRMFSDAKINPAFMINLFRQGCRYTIVLNDIDKDEWKYTARLEETIHEHE